MAPNNFNNVIVNQTFNAIDIAIHFLHLHLEVVSSVVAVVMNVTALLSQDDIMGWGWELDKFRLLFVPHSQARLTSEQTKFNIGALVCPLWRGLELAMMPTNSI